MRVMVVDDEPAICDMLTTVLSDEGYEAVAVGSGAEALARAVAEPPDLFLIDLMMPGMDGRTLAARLRATPELGTTPIIIMSAAVRTMATPPGVAEFLAKPFDLDQLLDSLERAIAGRGGAGCRLWGRGPHCVRPPPAPAPPAPPAPPRPRPPG